MIVLLVDDENLQLIRLENAVKKVINTDGSIVAFSNPVEASKFIEQNKVDIAFLDIEMPVINGIKLSKQLKSSNPLVNIIFVTAYDNYALNAYQLHASGYLNKPVNEEKIKQELDNLRYPIKINTDKKLQIKCFGNFDIMCNGEPLKFKRKKAKSYLHILLTVKELQLILMNSMPFYGKKIINHIVEI